MQEQPPDTRQGMTDTEGPLFAERGFDAARYIARARKSSRLYLASVVLLLQVAGCSVGPDHVRPPLVVDLPDTYLADRSRQDDRHGHAPAVGYPSAWWADFGDTTLNRLVNEATASNQDLRRAAARVLEARAMLGGARSDRWPRLDIGATGSRSRASMTAFGGRGTMYRTYYDANLTTRYELDLWGRLSRTEEAAWAALLQSEMNRRVVMQTLIADVVRTWLMARELQCQLDLTRQTIVSYRHTLDMVEERYGRGVVPAIEVHLARQNVLTAQAAEPEQTRLLTEAVRRLEILAGRYPAGRALAPADLPATCQQDENQHSSSAMPAPLPAVPAGLPSHLVERRPDLLAAEAGLHAATAGIGAAKARLFPTLALTGSAGSVSNDLSRWFEQGTDVWSLVANLAMPLVNRGATRSQIRAAEARAQQALASYHQAVLVALGEVENALDTEHFQAQREKLLMAAVHESRFALELAQQRYSSGLDNILTTLEVQRRLLSVTSSLLSTQRAHRTARVNLILALGGSWDAEQALNNAATADRAHEGDLE